MEEPALSKFKPAQIANVLKEFIKGDNPKAWSISSDATYMDFDNSSSWHSMYTVREPQLAALASLAVIPLWPAYSLSLVSQRMQHRRTRGYLTLKWGSLTPNLLKCSRSRLAPNLLKSATWQQIC